jgi:hypothetical protein
MKGVLVKQRSMNRLFPLSSKRREWDEVNVGSLVKNFVAPQSQRGKEKILDPIVELNEHINFHSFESSGDENSLIALLGVPRQKGDKKTLEHLVVDESPERQEEETPKVEKLFKEFLVLMDDFHVFVVKQREATT